MKRHHYNHNYQKPTQVFEGEKYVMVGCNVVCEVAEVENGNVIYRILDGGVDLGVSSIPVFDFLNKFEKVFDGYNHRPIRDSRYPGDGEESESDIFDYYDETSWYHLDEAEKYMDGYGHGQLRKIRKTKQKPFQKQTTQD